MKLATTEDTEDTVETDSINVALTSGLVLRVLRGGELAADILRNELSVFEADFSAEPGAATDIGAQTGGAFDRRLAADLEARVAIGRERGRP